MLRVCLFVLVVVEPMSGILYIFYNDKKYGSNFLGFINQSINQALFL